MLKKFNAENEIIFVANSDCKLDRQDVEIYYVDKDENDIVARKFLDKNLDLKNRILETVLRNDDVGAPSTKTHKRTLLERIFRKICRILKIYYRHALVDNLMEGQRDKPQ